MTTPPPPTQPQTAQSVAFGCSCGRRFARLDALLRHWRLCRGKVKP